MKLFLSIALMSVGMLSADWRSEQDPVRAKELAMAYFWQPSQVSGKDVKLAFHKFNQEDYQETFFKWKDEEGNTFLHILVLEGNNVELLKSTLGLGPETGVVNNHGKTPRQLAKNKEAMSEVFWEYEDADSWGRDEYPLDSVWSEESIASQKIILVLCMLGAAYYGWNTYVSRDNSVIA